MKDNLHRLAVLVACLVLFARVGFAGEGKKAPPHRAAAVGEKPGELDKKGRTKPNDKVIVPAEAPSESGESAPQISSAELPHTSAWSTSAVRDKGRVIKWQILCTGSGCGNDNVAFTSGYQDVHYLCGTLGQVAVGRGSSPSFGMNQGFWQAPIVEEYLRGDVNGDEITNVGDIVYLVSYLYKGGPAPDPVWVGDCNCDEIVNVGDIVFLVSYLYKGGPPPVC
ncbi:MAG: dockerin type I repeat-containing protein [Planctomycetota bacterium]